MSVIIPEHADGLSESREIEDTAEVELNGCRAAQAYIDEVPVGRQNRDVSPNARSLLLTISKGNHRLAATNGRTDIPNGLRELVIVNQAGESRRRHYATCMHWRHEIADGQSGKP